VKAAGVAAISSLLERIQSADPHAADAIAVSGAGEPLTRSRLTERCTALADLLTTLGLRVVALHMDNRPDWVVVDLACQLAAVCLVPLPTFFSAEQLKHVLDSVPVDAVFTDQPDILSPVCAGRVRPGPELALGSAALLRLEPAAMPAPKSAGRSLDARHRALPAGTGKVTFTSGSTGRPKGVCLGNRQLLAQAAVLAAALAAAAALERPRHLCLLPLSTLLENVAGVYAPLLAGGEVVVPSLAEIGFEGSSSLNPRVFLALLSRQRPDSVILTPQILQLLVTAAGQGWVPPASLRFVAVGGARVPPSLLEAAQALGIPAFEGYGLSECASVVSLNLPGANRPGSCGRPLPHIRVTLEDGEIRVSGNAMLGYAGEPGSWWQAGIATGDLGHLDDDGFLYIDGRKKNLLISSYGRNIAPEWVENEALAASDLAEGALVGGALAECLVFGDARPYCVALLTPRNAADADEAIQQAIDRCNARLPDYARIRRWHRLAQPLAASRDLLTENGRPKRPAILARYQGVIDALYATDSYTNNNYARTA
jgi:long-subunit acyl-CoA synthetase (AMP-forming)